MFKVKLYNSNFTPKNSWEPLGYMLVLKVSFGEVKNDKFIPIESLLQIFSNIAKLFGGKHKTGLK